jgi:hypothetical protein
MRFCLLFAPLLLAAAAAPGLAQDRPVSIETKALRFEISPATGAWSLADKAAGVTWRSGPHFGEIAVAAEGKPVRYPLGAFEAAGTGANRTFTFHPIPGHPEAAVRVKAAAAGRALDLSYEAADSLKLEEIRLLDGALSISAADKGYAVVPVREGLLIPSDSGAAFTRRFGTSEYEGCHMNMAGLVKAGAALLITWSDPYVAVEVKSALEPAQTLTASLVLRRTARAARIEALGRGDYVAIAKAYREEARARGYVVSWDARIKANPERAKYLGASNVKLWQALNRTMNEESTQEVSARVNWTFDEAARVAEHIKRDLKIDNVLFGLGGWMTRGYDNQHPDILPAAPELGGNEGFADCARRVQALGYLFSPHDNYQDMYRDSPSWDEHWIMKNQAGELVKGGKWAGGRAYLTCSRLAVELARRPQNLPAVKKLTNANSYFIDTTYAAGLQECFDPAHPLTRGDDMKWKQTISDYAREVFGSFGSEDGREWAIPHADFFEGITGVSGTWFATRDLLKQTGGVAIPLFELVYHDSIAAYGKYGYDNRRAAEYVLNHMVMGRPLNYHSIPNHTYWTIAGGVPEPAPASGPKDPALFVHGDGGWTEGMHPADRFLKNTHEVLSPLNELSARLPMTHHEFLGAGRTAQHSVFGEGAAAIHVVVNLGDSPITWTSRAGGAVELPPYGFVVEAPGFAAFRASTWNGRRYASPPLFTLRSLDGKPLAQSRRVRVYHGFGDAQLQFAAKLQTVARETVIER